MIKKLQRKTIQMSAAMVAGMMIGSSSAHATTASNNNFSSIAQNITTSIASLPGLLTGLSYMFGILLGVLGILKIKDHVENPNQTPLKDGAIRLAAGGGLFALPIIYTAMRETIGNDTSVTAAMLNTVSFNVN